jgi:hypothetical protein
MTEIVLSPESTLDFDIKGMSDVVQSSTSLSYNCDSTESVIIFEVQSNYLTRYTLSLSVGFLQTIRQV